PDHAALPWSMEIGERCGDLAANCGRQRKDMREWEGTLAVDLFVARRNVVWRETDPFHQADDFQQACRPADVCDTMLTSVWSEAQQRDRLQNGEPTIYDETGILKRLCHLCFGWGGRRHHGRPFRCICISRLTFLPFRTGVWIGR